jgi:acyl carrier protein
MVCVALFAFASLNVSAMSDAEKVKEILVNELGVEPSELIPEANLIEDLGADELDVVKILMQVEKDFGIKISDDDSANMATVRDIENAIANAKSGDTGS